MNKESVRGDLITKFREINDLTKSELAQMIGISVGTLNKLESGLMVNYRKKATLRRLVLVLGCELSDLKPVLGKDY